MKRSSHSCIMLCKGIVWSDITSTKGTVWSDITSTKGTVWRIITNTKGTVWRDIHPFTNTNRWVHTVSVLIKINTSLNSITQLPIWNTVWGGTNVWTSPPVQFYPVLIWNTTVVKDDAITNWTPALACVCLHEYPIANNNFNKSRCSLNTSRCTTRKHVLTSCRHALNEGWNISEQDDKVTCVLTQDVQLNIITLQQNVTSRYLSSCSLV